MVDAVAAIEAEAVATGINLPSGFAERVARRLTFADRRQPRE
jgi:hypothetical protein